jgi:hypothetical protein
MRMARMARRLPGRGPDVYTCTSIGTPAEGFVRGLPQEELAAAQRQVAEAAGWRDAVAAKDAELATLQAGGHWTCRAWTVHPQ